MRGLIVFLFLAVAFVASEKFSTGSEINLEDVELVLVNKYYEKSSRYSLKDAVNILKDPNFYNNDRETVFFTFGFNDDQDSISTSVIAEAFSERNDYNLIILDYGKFSGGNFFFDALPNSVKVKKSRGTKIF